MPGYLGDNHTKIVHHLANMKTECKIVYIKLYDKKYFSPDVLETAIKENFIPCKNCIS